MRANHHGSTSRHTPESMLGDAMNCLRAPDDLAERAIAARHGTRRRHGHARSLVAVVATALVATLAFGGTAYAVITSDFFARAYGDHGLGDSAGWTVEDSQGNPAATYTREFTTVAGEDTTQAIADATEEVNLSASLNGYTLTVESMVLDANGAGAVTFTLSGEDSFDLYEDAVSNELVFDEGPLQLITMRAGEGGSLNNRSYYDSDTSTPTELRGTMYFTARDVNDLKGGVTWEIAGVAPDGTAAEARTDAFTPSKVLATTTFTEAGGLEASLSPLSLRIGQPGKSEVYESVTSSVALNMSDGTSQTVMGDVATNYYVYTGWQGDSANHATLALSQVVDPNEVTSISVTGNDYTESERTPFSRTFEK